MRIANFYFTFNIIKMIFIILSVLFFLTTLLFIHAGAREWRENEKLRAKLFDMAHPELAENMRNFSKALSEGAMSIEKMEAANRERKRRDEIEELKNNFPKFAKVFFGADLGEGDDFGLAVAYNFQASKDYKKGDPVSSLDMHIASKTRLLDDLEAVFRLEKRGYKPFDPVVYKKLVAKHKKELASLKTERSKK